MSVGPQPQGNWLDQLTSTQRFVLQMGMAGVVCIMLFILWYAYQSVVREEIAGLKESVKNNETRIDAVRADARAAADAHGKAAQALASDALQQRQELLKLAQDQRLHDSEERASTRVAVDALAKRLEVLAQPPAPAGSKKLEKEMVDK